MTVWEVMRRIAVVVLIGPFLVLFAPFWFVIAGTAVLVIGLLTPNRQPWYWRFARDTVAFPFYGFWDTLTGSDLVDRSL